MRIILIRKELGIIYSIYNSNMLFSELSDDTYIFLFFFILIVLADQFFFNN